MNSCPNKKQRRIYGSQFCGSPLLKVSNAVCEDGALRTAVTTREPDTYFSIPARVTASVDGKRYTVTGFITFDSCEQCNDGHYAFTANAYGKNGHVIKDN